MKRIIKILCAVILIASVFCIPVCAATGDVASAIEGTWDTASQQIKTVVNNVVFPAIDLILAVFFFASLALLILIIGNMASLNGRPRPSCLPVWYLP